MTDNTVSLTAEAEGRGAIAISILLLTSALFGLLAYKWSASSTVLGAVRASGHWSGTFHGLIDGGVFAAASFYFQKIWRALAYGIAIGAAVQTACRFAITRFKLRDMPLLRSPLSSCAVGMPLMLCSCCVTPVVVTLLRRKVRVGSAVALLLASPVLNPAAIVLTFLLFPLHLGVARLVAAFTLAIAVPVVVQWRVAGLSGRDYLRDDESSMPATEAWTLVAVVKEFSMNAFRVALITIPLIAVGVLASSSVMPFIGMWSKGLIGGLFVATVAVLVALPTFFEIPIAIALLSSGSPAAAAAVLIAGPAINAGSLMVVSKEIGPRAAALIGFAVWIVACLTVVTFASFRV
jgi:uncharacterized protein